MRLFPRHHAIRGCLTDNVLYQFYRLSSECPEACRFFQDYRLIGGVDEDTLTVLVVSIGHHMMVYRHYLLWMHRYAVGQIRERPG